MKRAILHAESRGDGRQSRRVASEIFLFFSFFPLSLVVSLFLSLLARISHVSASSYYHNIARGPLFVVPKEPGERARRGLWTVRTQLSTADLFLTHLRTGKARRMGDAGPFGFPKNRPLARLVSSFSFVAQEPTSTNICRGLYEKKKLTSLS